METGKVEFAPDYKSKQPRLPKNFGLVEMVCADGQHRFLSGAPRCGCGKTENLHVTHQRLRIAVSELAVTWYKGDEQPRDKTNLKAAIKALLDFEKQSIK